jgi:MFS transporter, FSR family, fosmidomycin resistance protein
VAALLATHESGAPAAPRREAPDAARAPDRWGPFSRVAAIAVLRSGVYFGLQAFLASYFIEQLGTSEAFGNAALTVMLVAGVAGTLAGGRLADRVDRRSVLGGFMLAIPPLLALLLLTGDPAAGAVLVAAIGFVTIGNFSVTIVIGQEYLPGRPALASGITLGLAIGIGGLIAAALGPLADELGLPAVLWVLAALPLPAAALAATLPRAR